ncbi:MAG: Fis family transcriptional regulator [Ignavibacteriales bacterium CG18_big_fil_WC_8_21_14_2_50_31_20]|nr:MAG: Fis family transcriptional regulator [Ignavibacteriales bacterium CG18_big_fil_WC_8_21_14_2_50_31_20]
MISKKILVIDDEEFIRINLKDIFTSEKYKVDVASLGKRGLNAIKTNQYDLAFLDINLPDMNGIEVLKEIKKIEPDLLVIIITGFASVESAVNAIKLGAYDYIKKPFKADAIKLITKLALETQSLKKKVIELETQQKEHSDISSIVGFSPEIDTLKNHISEIAKYDSETVLITGESGTGKELVASAIHNLSPRKEKSFVEINCATIPENLLESELFGHEKGAFTNAYSKKIGLLEIAEGGTLFLDEIGEMSLSLQAKLLRVLENKKIRRLGSNKDLEIDVRIIAATNKNLKNAISESTFRNDLYYRLNVLRIEVPPLRARGSDIILLAEYFLNIFKKKFSKPVEKFDEQAKTVLRNYNWPGNVRELRNVIERTCILHNEKIIKSEHIAGDFIGSTRQLGLKICDEDFDLTQASYEEILNNIEFKIISKAVSISDGNISQTAKLLQIPRETLRYKLTKLNIS